MPTARTGNRSRGISMVDMRVRRSRSDSSSSLRYTRPTLRRDMSIGLRESVMGSNDLDEDFLEILFVVLIAELVERALGKQFARVDDADGVTELFDFAHDVGRKDDGLAAVAALAGE